MPVVLAEGGGRRRILFDRSYSDKPVRCLREAFAESSRAAEKVKHAHLLARWFSTVSVHG